MHLLQAETLSQVTNWEPLWRLRESRLAVLSKQNKFWEINIDINREPAVRHLIIKEQEEEVGN